MCHSVSKLIERLSTRFSTELRTSTALVIGSSVSEMAEGAVEYRRSLGEASKATAMNHKIINNSKK